MRRGDLQTEADVRAMLRQVYRMPFSVWGNSEPLAPEEGRLENHPESWSPGHCQEGKSGCATEESWQTAAGD